MHAGLKSQHDAGRHGRIRIDEEQALTSRGTSARVSGGGNLAMLDADNSRRAIQRDLAGIIG